MTKDLGISYILEPKEVGVIIKGGMKREQRRRKKIWKIQL